MSLRLGVFSEVSTSFDRILKFEVYNHSIGKFWGIFWFIENNRNPKVLFLRMAYKIQCLTQEGIIACFVCFFNVSTYKCLFWKVSFHLSKPNNIESLENISYFFCYFLTYCLQLHSILPTTYYLCFPQRADDTWEHKAPAEWNWSQKYSVTLKPQFRYLRLADSLKVWMLFLSAQLMKHWKELYFILIILRTQPSSC